MPLEPFVAARRSGRGWGGAEEEMGAGAGRAGGAHIRCTAAMSGPASSKLPRLLYASAYNGSIRTAFSRWTCAQRI